MRPMSSDRWLGLVVLIFAAVLVLAWAPLDTETGLVEVVRRKTNIGDQFGPTAAGIVLALGAALTVWRADVTSPGLSRTNTLWILGLLVLFAIAFGLMRYTGPALAALTTETGYRPLRASLPWKYLGYVLGGTTLVTGLGIFVRGGFRWSDLVAGLLASILIALAYDLPFDDLLLPPNGDV